MHHRQFRETICDAEVAYAISSVVLTHHLTGGADRASFDRSEYSRAAKVAEITRRVYFKKTVPFRLAA